MQLSTLESLNALNRYSSGVSVQKLKTFDKNSDGKISRDEGKAAGFADADIALIDQRFREGLPKGASTVVFSNRELEAHTLVAHVEEQFVTLDANRDGRISKAEVGKALGNPALKGETSAAVVASYKLFSELKILSDDQSYLPKLPDHPWLNKIPLHNWDEMGISRQDLNSFKHLIRDDGNEVVSKTIGRFSISQYISENRERRLFPEGVASIRPDHIQQGELGDCYFLAAVASLADTPAGKKQIFDMIQDKGNGKFSVTFPGKPAITIDAPTDAEIALYSTSGKDGQWLAVLEKAYAHQTNQDAWFIQRSNPYDAIGNGAQLSTGIKGITGSGSDTDILLLTSESSLRTKLQQALKAGRVTTSSVSKTLNPMADQSRTANGLPRGHAYSVLAFDAKKDQVTVRNPWGNTELIDAKGQPRDGVDDGTFTMSLTEFKSTFSMITYANR